MTRQEFISNLALLNDLEFDNLVLIYQGGKKIVPVSSDLPGLEKLPIIPVIEDSYETYYQLRAKEMALLAAANFAALTEPVSLGFKQMSPEEQKLRLEAYERDSLKTLEQYSEDLKNWDNDKTEHPDWFTSNETLADYKKWEREYNEFMNMYNNTKNALLEGKYPYNLCINNALKHYGLNAYTNLYFLKHPDEYGFKETSEAPQLGDIYSNDHHMVMLTSFAPDGSPRYTWARGNEYEGMVNDGEFNVDKENMKHYRFKGTSKHRELWKLELDSKSEVKKHAEGGMMEELYKQVKLCKQGSILDQLKEQLGDSEIIDLLQHFGIDELMQGGLKNTKNMSIQIVIEGGQEEDCKGHKTPKLKKIEIGDKQYEVEVVTTPEDMELGLGHRESLDEGKGMLFDFEEVQDEVTFNMEECHFPLDIIFINDDNEVIRVAKGCPDSLDLFTELDVRYVLEVNPESGVSKGDELDLNPEEGAPTMKVLAPDGSTLMELEGGERIFSRKNTKTLIKMAKRAEKSKSELDYKRLGKKMFKYILTQNTNKPEYVEVPEE